MMPTISDQVAKAFFFTSLFTIFASSAFLFGVTVGKFQIWPHRPLDIMYSHIKAFINAGAWVPQGRVLEVPAMASRERVVVHQAKERMPGYRAIMGWDSVSQNHAIWLLDDHGTEVHSWIIGYHALDAADSSGGEVTPHGMKVLADGSVLINFDRGTALTRLDACGDSIWIRKDGVYHHLIEHAEHGSF